MNLSEYRLFKLYCENIIEEAEEKCNKHYYSIKKYQFTPPNKSGLWYNRK